MQGYDATFRGYLKPSQTSTMELFWENSWQLKAVDYIHKGSIVDVRLGFEYNSDIQNMPKGHKVCFTPWVNKINKAYDN